MGQHKLRSKRVPFRQQLQALSKQLQGLLEQHSSLATTNQALLLKQSLLQGLAEGMQALQVSRALVDPDGLIDGLSQPVFSERQLEMLVQQEAALMQQLCGSDASHSSRTNSSSGQDSVLDLGIDTIAPPGDPMAAFRTHVQAPPVPHAANMTARELAQQYRDWLQQFSMQLNKLQGWQSAAAAADALKETFNRWAACSQHKGMRGGCMSNLAARLGTCTAENTWCRGRCVLTVTTVQQQSCRGCMFLQRLRPVILPPSTAAE